MPKLAESLRKIGEKLDELASNGTGTIDGVRVVEYRIDVMIYLRDLSPQTHSKLINLGFVQTGESKAIKLIIGSIDARKLDELEKCEAIIRVTPVPS